MNLVSGAVSSLIPKLLQLIGDEYKLQKDLKNSIKSLSKELESIHACLCDVSEVPWDQLNDLVKVWASDIREASYDMEDVIDTFLVLVEGREPPSRSRLKRAMNKITNMCSKGMARHDVGCSIQDIMKQLEEVASRHARYKINDHLLKSGARYEIDDLAANSGTTLSTLDPRLKAMYTEVASLVGIDEPSKDIISKLSIHKGDMARRKKIVSIVGTGGLGKTTLAKAVYEKLKGNFDCCAFVPVGRNPNPTKVLMDILYELDKNKCADIDTNNRNKRLIDNLREFLMDKRYFIVIDDVWENISWEGTIELALLENNCGSRIIITTRNSVIAEKIGDEVYKIQPLSGDNSKKLLYARTRQYSDNQSNKIINEILKKCDGVPLAIITMASLLVGKPLEKWYHVYKSIGFGHEVTEQMEITMKILSYSYYDLPSHLRTCLLYLSVFPEDTTIDKDSLIWKWIAEGFIQEREGIWLFELGEKYFYDLVNRSLIQVEEKASENELITTYRVHDMVLDLIRSISSIGNFVTVLDTDEFTVSPPIRRARRLALHSKTMQQSPQDNVLATLKVIRSLSAYGCDFDKWVPFSSFKLLRVLVMDNCENIGSSGLMHLGNLLHLRHLELKYARNIYELPNEIGSLKFLQAVHLKETGISDLTRISNVTRLVCLKCDDCGPWGAPYGIGKLTSLQELRISIHGRLRDNYDRVRQFFKALGSLTNLRVLDCFVCIMDVSMWRDLVLSLPNLPKLQHFSFKDASYRTGEHSALMEEAGFVFPQDLRFLDLLNFRFTCLPSCISTAYLPNLTHLSLHVDAIDEKGMKFLGSLHELRFLHLITESTVTVSNISASNGYFQKLRFCWMPFSMIQFQCKEEDLSVSMHIWTGTFGSSKNYCRVPPTAVMPNLEMLWICVSMSVLKDVNGDCGNIGLQYFPSLQEVRVGLSCNGTSAAEADEAKAALRKATEAHPNRPKLEVW